MKFVIFNQIVFRLLSFTLRSSMNKNNSPNPSSPNKNYDKNSNLQKEPLKRKVASDPGVAFPKALSGSGEKNQRRNDSKISKNLRDSKGKNLKKKPPKKLSNLPPGVVFTTNNKNEFKVMNIIGAGGFGQVYRVIETKSNIEYALKTESSREANKESRLKIEVLVFRALEKQFEISPEKCSHFIRMIDCGMTESLKFLVMTYTGQNLEEIRSVILKTDFSFTTALLLSIATLEAISDFHALGWLHRDIKPSNFVIGKTDRRAVLILDFGMSQKFLKRTDRLTRIGKFEGTIRYASRNCHTGHVQWPKDDFESWIYQSIEFFEKRAIPWRRNPDKKDVYNLKRKFFRNEGTAQCYTVCPKEFSQIAKFINDLGNSNEPADITFITETLHNIRKNRKIEMETLYDWEEVEETGIKKSPNPPYVPQTNAEGSPAAASASGEKKPGDFDSQKESKGTSNNNNQSTSDRRKLKRTKDSQVFDFGHHYNRSYRFRNSNNNVAAKKSKRSTDSAILSDRRKRGSTTPVSSRSPDLSSRNHLHRSLRKRNTNINENSRTKIGGGGGSGRTATAKESNDNSRRKPF